MPLSEHQMLKMKMRREAILDAATSLFATEGYDGTTIKKVSQAANVSFGSVFTYFKDKEELFYTAVVEPLEDFSVRVLDFNPHAEHPIEELKKMIDKHIKFFAGINSYLTLVVQVIGQHQRFPEIFEKLDAFHDNFRTQISQLVQNGQKKGLLVEQESLPVATLYTSLLIGIRLNNTDTLYNHMWDHYVSATIQLFGPIHK